MIANNNVCKTLALATLLSMTSLAADAPKMDNKPVKQREYETYKYSPQYYDLKGGDTGAFVTGEFLYWYARETNLDIGYSTKNILQPTPNPLNAPFQESPLYLTTQRKISFCQLNGTRDLELE